MRKIILIPLFLGLVFLTGAAKVNTQKLLLAAQKGDAASQNAVGLLYWQGQGVLKSPSEAVKWFKASAKQGNASAMTNLGVMLETGQGVYKDERLAAGWYLKAADKGSPMAQYNLGLMYEGGRGVGRDLNKAFSWYKQAAANGNQAAQARAVRIQEAMAGKAAGQGKKERGSGKVVIVVLLVLAGAAIGAGYYLGHLRHQPMPKT